MTDMMGAENNKASNEEEVWLTSGEAADLLPNVSRRSVQAWAASGKLPGSIQLPSGQYRIPKSAIDALLAGGKLG